MGLEDWWRQGCHLRPVSTQQMRQTRPQESGGSPQTIFKRRFPLLGDGRHRRAVLEQFTCYFLVPCHCSDMQRRASIASLGRNVRPLFKKHSRSFNAAPENSTHQRRGLRDQVTTLLDDCAVLDQPPHILRCPPESCDPERRLVAGLFHALLGNRKASWPTCHRCHGIFPRHGPTMWPLWRHGRNTDRSWLEPPSVSPDSSRQRLLSPVCRLLLAACYLLAVAPPSLPSLRHLSRRPAKIPPPVCPACLPAPACPACWLEI